jgi:hypothetical protein
LEEQRRLFDVWRVAAAGACMPTRAAFQPRAFGPLLPYISLIDMGPDDAPRVRVAGSALRDVLGGDPREALLDPAVAPGQRETLARLCAEARPACGLTPGKGPPGSPRAVRAWLRLPLGHGATVEAIVGLDLMLTGARVPAWALAKVVGA